MSYKKFQFKDIKKDRYRAKLTEVKEAVGTYGKYLRFIFTIEEDELKGIRFSGIAKPIPLKQGKFYRWVEAILGQEPELEFYVEDLIGKECIISISMGANGFYFVKDVYMKDLFILTKGVFSGDFFIRKNF